MIEPISAEQQVFFADQGYLILRRALASEAVLALRQIAETELSQAAAPLEYEAEVHYPGSPINLEAPGGRTIRRLLRAWDRQAEYRAWATRPDLVEAVAALLQSRQLCLVRNHHNCVMTKHPQYSSATLWHQDIRYWSFQQADLVNAWLALGEEKARNGCMRLIPGSHRVDWESDRFDQEKFFRPDHPANRVLMHQALRAELQPGDVLLFHSRLLHAAGRNHTQERKIALVFSYRRADNLPLPGTRSTQQEDILLNLDHQPYWQESAVGS